MTTRTIDDLKILQALPLEIKIMKSKRRITEFVEYFGVNDCYVSFSGGKDSVVLLDLVRSIYPQIEAIYSDTGLEYPEIREYVKSFSNVRIVRPKMNFKEVITKYGYPVVSKEISNSVYQGRRHLERGGNGEIVRLKKLYGTLLDSSGKKSIYNSEKFKPLLQAPFLISDVCCEKMKKNPLREVQKYPLVGTMTYESQLRKTQWLRTGCNLFDSKKPKSIPISFWTEQDVLHYIQNNRIRVCSVYGELVEKAEFHSYDSLGIFSEISKELMFTKAQRTGCIFCAYGSHLEKQMSRFERLKKTHSRLYQYCIGGGAIDQADGLWKPDSKGLGMGYVFDWCNSNINNFKIRY